MLAPAPRHFGVAERLPPGVPVIVAHGVHDTVVDIAGSRRLVASSTPEVARLLEVDDDHRLQTLVDNGVLGDLVRELVSRG